jgi:hypothetical protein
MKIRDLIGKKIAVICSTETDAKKVVSMLHSAGFGWICGADRAKTYWDELFEGIGYDLLQKLVIHYAPMYHYIESDFKIVSATDFIEANSAIVNIPDIDFDIH